MTNLPIKFYVFVCPPKSLAKQQSWKNDKIHLFSGPQSLKRADQRVGKDYAEKQHIPPGAHQRQAKGQREIQEIKRRKEVCPYDLRNGFAGLGAVQVCLSGRSQGRGSFAA